MTRYDDVIARALATLPRDHAERQAAYNRARAIQIAQLRSANPPLPEVAIEAEQASLEEAIRRVELQFGGAADESIAPPAVAAARRPGRRWSAVRIAVLCCIGAVALLISGFLYMHWGAGGRTAYRQLRQWIAPPAERASPAPKVEAQANEPVPFVYRRQLVHYRSTNPAGTLVIDKAQRHLYVIMANVTAIRYGIALGGNCLEAVGRYAVSRKAGTSDQPPLSGQNALYLDSDTRLIHGTDAARSIGQSVGAGCFLLMPPDLAELYGRVPVGTRVVVN